MYVLLVLLIIVKYVPPMPMLVISANLVFVDRLAIVYDVVRIIVSDALETIVYVVL